MKKRKGVLELYILLNFIIFYFMVQKDPLVSLATRIDFGAPVGFALAEGQVWRIITPMFLHSSWDHVIMNCIFLYIYGRRIERYYGSKKFIFITLALGFISSLGHHLISSHLGPSVGASGVLFGYTAFYIYLLLFNREELKANSSIILFVFLSITLVSALYSAFFTKTPWPVYYNTPVDHTSHLAHASGFMGGLGIFLYLDSKVKKNVKWVLAGSLVLLTLLLGVKIINYKGSEDYYITKVNYLTEKKLPSKANYYMREYLNKFVRPQD